MISRYNTWTSALREENETATQVTPKTAMARKPEPIRDTYQEWDSGEQTNPTGEETLTAAVNHTARPIAFSMSHPQVTGPTTSATIDLARAYDSDRTMWVISAGATTVEAAVTSLGLTPCTLTRTDERPLWQERTDAPTMQTLLDRARRQRTDEQKGPQWTVIQAQANWREQQRRNMHDIIRLTHKLGTKATIIAYCNGSETQTEKTSRQAELQTVAEELGWHIYEGNLKNTKAGGHVEANTHYFVLANNDITTAWSSCTPMDDDEPEEMSNILDVNDGIFEDCNKRI
jgi:hypothetical protein